MDRNDLPLTEREKKQHAAMREQIAHHEAGHAVMGVYLSLAFYSVTIKPESPAVDHVRMGHVKPLIGGKRIYDLSQREHDNNVLFSLAGHQAERIFTGRRLRWHSAMTDYKAVYEYASYRHRFLESNDESIELYLKWMEHNARQILIQPIMWRAVQAVAATLIEKETLSYRQVRRVYQSATGGTLYSRSRLWEPPKTTSDKP